MQMEHPRKEHPRSLEGMVLHVRIRNRRASFERHLTGLYFSSTRIPLSAQTIGTSYRFSDLSISTRAQTNSSSRSRARRRAAARPPAPSGRQANAGQFGLSEAPTVTRLTYPTSPRSAVRLVL